ncbi:MAG TPA: YkgJ family cysteine cluster protein [Abditibacteriaceae bacterium]
MPGTKYNCFDCHAPCCTLYERVEVSEEDCENLAVYFNLSVEDFKRRYTTMIGDERCLRRKPDNLLDGHTCILLDKSTRLCGAHLARPYVCRVWPPKHTRGRCPYYDVLQFERRHQGEGVLLNIKLSLRDE